MSRALVRSEQALEAEHRHGRGGHPRWRGEIALSELRCGVSCHHHDHPRQVLVAQTSVRDLDEMERRWKCSVCNEPAAWGFDRDRGPGGRR